MGLIITKHLVKMLATSILFLAYQRVEERNFD
jgi:hypothetical protein